MFNRVVVTGLGAITPVGLDVEETWKSLLAGTSGISTITSFNPEKFPVKVAAEVKNFDPTKYLDPTTAKYSDRFTQFALGATIQAVQMSGIKITDNNKYDIGIILGSGVGGIGSLERQIEILSTRGPLRVSPYVIPMMIADNASGQISIKLGIHGFNFSVVSACSTGTDAIGLAYKLIKYGEYSALIVGGSDAAITPIGIAGFAQAGALSKNADPRTACRPFDALRDGFIMGEGAGVLVLENLESAIAREANIIAEVIGYGATSDAFHITHPSENGEAGVKAIERCISGINHNEIGYINAHGTSTPLNDLIETKIIRKVFGERAYQIPVSSIKSMLGHMLGAAGAVEAIVCCKVVKEGILPPTINYENKDPQCDLDYVPNKARQHYVDTAISTSFGFGGHNSVIAIKKYYTN